MLLWHGVNMGKKSKGPGFFNTQFITALISTSLVLILLGVIVFFVLTAHNLSAYVKENINIEVLLNDEMSTEDVAKLKDEISSRPYLKTIDYISKEEAAKEQAKAMGTDPSEFLGFNPFTATFEIKVHSDYANNDSLTHIERELKAKDNVMDVIYQKELMDIINKNIGKLSVILLIIAALFTYISFTLINNTVKLTIFSKRFTINTMKLVGASWGFIMRPFTSKSLLLGFLSAIIADGLILLGIYKLMEFEPNMIAVINMEVIAIVGASVLLFGLLISLSCTYFSMRKYLRMSSNELYHI